MFATQLISPMKSLILYSTIVGGFYAQTDDLDLAINAARAHVGSDTWKRGFSGTDPSGATVAANWYLKEAGITPVQFEGELTHVGFVQNSDASGNTYPKLRVGVQCMEDQFLLSLDLKGDVAQRLVVKLDNCNLGDYVRISAWPTFVERNGRTFVNHAASMKDGQGKEIPVNAEFSAEVKKSTNGVESALLAAGISDKKIVATAKATKRIEAHRDLLQKIQSHFTEAKTTA
jgi:hypothetical protein